MKKTGVILGVVGAFILGMVTTGWEQWAFLGKEKTSARAREEVPGQLAFLKQENVRLQKAALDLQRQLRELQEEEFHINIQEQVVSLRELEFLEEVQLKKMSRDDLPALILGEIDRQYSPEELRNLVKSYAVFGFMPEDFDLKEAYKALLSEQIAAFYNQHSGELVMFEGNHLDNIMNQVILAHELTHALQDQHFDLKSLPIEDKSNDDRALGALSLIEGDATLLMGMFLLENKENMKVLSLLEGMLGQSTEALASVPGIIRESLLFPYLKGQEFVMSLYAQGGFQAISDAFDDPPNSSSEILHPERYLSIQRILPALPEWQVMEENQEKRLIRENVLGEFGLRVWLQEYMSRENAENAADGWRGDGYRVFMDKAGKHLQFVHWSKWENIQEAEEFLRAAIAAGKEYFPEEGEFLVKRMAPDEVVMIRAKSKEEQAELEALAPVAWSAAR